MKLNKSIFDISNSGRAIGSDKACGRVTIDPDWQLNSTESHWAGSPRGPFRYYQSDPYGATPTPVTIEVELPNIKTINIDRSMSQDIGTCKISMYNQWHDTNNMVPELLNQLGKPGYFWPQRGGDQWSQELWDQQPSVGALQKDGTIDETFEWTNAIVPNALIRTYQGYGGHDLSIDQAIYQGKIMLTGVWLVDSISAGTDGLLSIECRDVGRLLLEQTVYPPLVPAILYPLEYFPAGKSSFDSPWGARPSSVTDLNTSQAAWSEQRCFYKEASTDDDPGDNTSIMGHRPSEAADGNLNNWTWSKGFKNPTGSENKAYWEFWVGNTLRDAQTMTYIPDIVAQNEYWGYGAGADGHGGGGTDRRRIESGQSFTVNGGELVMQKDGNLVLYHGKAEGTALTGVPVWSSGTHGRTDAYAEVKPDGRFVICSGGGPGEYPLGTVIWEAPGTAGHPNSILAFQWDQNLVMFAPDAVSDHPAFGGSGVSGLVENSAIWTADSYITIAKTGQKPKPVKSVSFTPWAGGSIAYISVWDLQTGAWAAPLGTVPGYDGIGYVAKSSVPTNVPEGNMENEITVTFPTEIYTNRIRITLLAPSAPGWYPSYVPDPITGGDYRCGLRSVYCRVRGAAASAYAGDPNALMWTYAFDSHPDRGYWVTDSNGVVYGFGEAANYDSTSFGSPDIALAGPWNDAKELFKQNSKAPLNTYAARWLQAWTPDQIAFFDLAPIDPPYMRGGTWPDGNAYWITDSDGTSKDSFADSERWFRRTITINVNPGQQAVMFWTGDNEAEFYINRVGQPLRTVNSQLAYNWAYGFTTVLEDPDAPGSEQFSGEFELTWRVKNLASVDGTDFNPASLLWALKVNGAVTAVSDHQTQVSSYGNFMVDMAATPSGEGYWLLDRYGRIYNYGDAAHYGHMPLQRPSQIATTAGLYAYSGSNGMDFALSGKQAIGITRTATGNGYWVLYTNGNVYGFGDARYQQSEADLAAEIPQTYIGYYDENRDYYPGNIVSHRVNLVSPIKYWKRKDYPIGEPGSSNVYSVGGGAGHTPEAGSYWSDISDYFFPSEYSSEIIYPGGVVVYYQGNYWRRKDFLYDPTPHTPTVGAYWQKLSLIPGTHITLQSETPDNPIADAGWPTKLPAPSGPMTGPMMTQSVPYVYKLPERGQALGYRLVSVAPNSYEYARRGTAICSHPSKHGFWMTDGSGQVWAYGDCKHKGELKIRTYNKGMTDSFSLELFDWATCIESTTTGDGYWIAFGSGKVAAFGDAVGQGPVDINQDNPELNQFNATSVNYMDDYGNDWTQERNNLWGLRRDPDGRGFWILKASGSVHSYNAEDWGQPGYFGYSGNRWHDSNIDDYSDIVKDLAAWCGFTAYSENEPNIKTEFKNRPPVWGNIEKTGIFSDSRLPGDRWDRRTALDCINQVKQIVGYNFFIDDRGGIRFESPNWWQAGNFDEDGFQIAVRYDINNDWERVYRDLEAYPAYDPSTGLGETWQEFLEREGAENFIPEIHEGVSMMGYNAVLDGSSYVSEIIVGADQPDFRSPDSQNSFVSFKPQSSLSDIRPGVPNLRNINRVAAWVDNYFINPKEQQTMAELINLQIWFNQRIGNIAMVGNPNIGMNDQIRVVERNTSETYIHYVRSVSSSMDLDTGVYTMNLSTNRLGNDSNWVITTTSNVQTIKEGTNVTAGTFTITYDGQTTTAIAHNANATTVQAALIALPNLNVGDVVVTGGIVTTTPFTLTFGGSLAGTNVAAVTVNVTSLTGTLIVDAYNPMTQIQISETVSRWQDGLGRKVPIGPSAVGRPSLTGAFRRS